MGSVSDGSPTPSYGGVVLAVNPGSSSLKAAVRDPKPVLEMSFDRVGSEDGLIQALERLAKQLYDRGIQPDAVVHRVVQGGPDHHRTTLVDDQLLTELRNATPLAPLHLPSDIASMETARRIWRSAVHVACFDTTFHADLPEASSRLPVAPELADLGVRRYGFHGLSVQSVVRAVPDLGQAVVAHLGSGCSVTAVADGRSRHTTMSLTPTGGMMSATRSGDLDPEIVLFLIEECGYDVPTLRDRLDRHSGVAGLAGGTSDVRAVELAARDGDPVAAVALDVFVQAAASSIAACALHLDRFETLVFTGGVGEHSEDIRSRICSLLLTVRSDRTSGTEGSAALQQSGVRVLVVPADEQIVMDDEARALLGRRPA
jgi:acetate kinase